MAFRWDKIIRVLGAGAYGTVYLAKTNEPLFPQVAVKSSDIDHCDSLIKEKIILSELQGCPEVVTCFGSQITAGRGGRRIYNLLLEYAPGGTLADVMKWNGGRLAEAQIGVATRMVLKGLRTVHASGVVHCDLKPENILAFPPDSARTGSVFPRLKVADFGIAKFPDYDEHDKEIFSFSKFRGTPAYMSPEAVGEQLVTPALDIWSLGCIVIEMFTGKIAVNDHHHEYDLDQLALKLGFLREGPKIPAGMSVTGRDFLHRCLATDPSMRWTAGELLKHPFVAATF